MRKVLFPDSELLLAYRPLDEVDLPHLVHAPTVAVVITSTVMEMLADDGQHHPVPELARRARETLNRVDKWLKAGKPIGSGITVTFLSSKPDRRTMENYRLDWQRRGDVLCATILKYQQRNPETDVILLTGDRIARQRAEDLGIQVTTLPGAYKLPEPRTALEQQRQHSDEASAGFRYRTSSLKLSFPDGGDELAVSLAPQLTTLPAAMGARLAEVVTNVRRELARLEPGDARAEQSADQEVRSGLSVRRQVGSAEAFPDRTSPEEVARYKRELEAYPDKFESYLYRQLEVMNLRRRTIRLDLTLENRGGAPASAILLTVTLPENLQWQQQPTQNDLPASPPPLPPWMRGQAETDDFREAASILAQGERSPAQQGSIKRPGADPRVSGGGRMLTWNLGTFRHQQRHALPPLYVRFRDQDAIDDFAIVYEIEESRTSLLVRGQLSVTLDLGSPSSATV